jgi:uncharacterized peroxidase-related enzyme
MVCDDAKEADGFVHALVKEWRKAPLSDQDMALCKLAEKLTHHQNQMSSEDLDKLRVYGFNDLAIHDTVQVIAYFNYITPIADALDVEQEDFILPWEK